MRDILERCVELDRAAYEAYRGIARECEDSELADVFGKLATEKLHHVDWWTDLLAAWESGLVPDIADRHALAAELNQVAGYIDEVLPDRFDSLDADQMLDLAAKIEFYMLSPVFGELADVMGPGSHLDRRRSDTQHINRLAEAINRYHSVADRAAFLAHMLIRCHRDQQRFVALSVNDQLTGLHNRRGVLGHLKQWLAWSARYIRPVSVVLVDVDRFKEINDTVGNSVGDEVLRRVADALRSAARNSDIVGRFGGDEFLVLAPETGGPELIQLMGRLVERVRETSMSIDGQNPHVTVSVGGAWVGGGASVESETIIAAADRSLYDAKEAGRDQAAQPRQAFAPVD